MVMSKLSISDFKNELLVCHESVFSNEHQYFSPVFLFLMASAFSKYLDENTKCTKKFLKPFEGLNLSSSSLGR